MRNGRKQAPCFLRNHSPGSGSLADEVDRGKPWDVGEGGYQVGNFPVLWGGVER